MKCIVTSPETESTDRVAPNSEKRSLLTKLIKTQNKAVRTKDKMYIRGC